MHTNPFKIRVPKLLFKLNIYILTKKDNHTGVVINVLSVGQYEQLHRGKVPHGDQESRTQILLVDPLTV